MRSKILIKLLILLMISTSTISCSRLSQSTKKTPGQVLSVSLKTGDIAPFNGVLVESEMFKILIKATTKDDCK